MNKTRLLLVWLLVFSTSPLLVADDFFFDSAGVKIHYTVEGKGEPVVLIHGFSASIQMNWGAPPTEQAIEAANKIFMNGNDPLALAAAARGLRLSVSESQLRANKVPVLALIGEVDPLKEGVDRMDGVLPGLQVVVIPRATHITAFSQPLFVSSLRSFLSAHPAGQ